MPSAGENSDHSHPGKLAGRHLPEGSAILLAGAPARETQTWRAYGNAIGTSTEPWSELSNSGNNPVFSKSTWYTRPAVQRARPSTINNNLTHAGTWAWSPTRITTPARSCRQKSAHCDSRVGASWEFCRMLDLVWILCVVLLVTIYTYLKNIKLATQRRLSLCINFNKYYVVVKK